MINIVLKTYNVKDNNGKLLKMFISGNKSVIILTNVHWSYFLSQQIIPYDKWPVIFLDFFFFF